MFQGSGSSARFESNSFINLSNGRTYGQIDPHSHYRRENRESGGRSSTQLTSSCLGLNMPCHFAKPVAMNSNIAHRT